MPAPVAKIAMRGAFHNRLGPLQGDIRVKSLERSKIPRAGKGGADFADTQALIEFGIAAAGDVERQYVLG